MNIIEKSFDPVVIGQTVVGSLIFWLLFEALKRAISKGVDLVSHHNKNLRREALFFEFLQEQANLNNGPKAAPFLSICIYGSLGNFVKAVIYLCFGLIANTLFGPISIAAYLIAIFYLFRSYRALSIEHNGSRTRQDYEKRISEIMKELEALDAT